MAVLHDLSADPDENEEPIDEPRLVDSEPSINELLTKASINSIKNSLSLVGGTVRTTTALGKYALNVARKEIPSPDVDAPKTVLNRSVGPHRVFDAAEFPLEGFKDIKNATDTTINDVGLGVISGALRRYLEAKGELPAEGSLATAIPLNMRTRRDMTEDNNQVGSAYASLHTDIAAPLDRLQSIRASTEEAKLSSEGNPLVDALKLAGVFSPAIARTAAGFWSRNELSRFVPMNVSTCISNVAGPDFPLYCAGAKMVDYYGLGVLTPGLGIFHLIFSYSGKITLSVLADRDIIPDPEFYHDCLVASYEELYAAASEIMPAKGSAKAVAAKAKIASPKRERVEEKPAKKRAKTKTKPKANAKAKAKTKAKAKPKVKTKAKAKAPAKAKAKTKVKSKAKARPKATRRKTAGKVKPKLK